MIKEVQMLSTTITQLRALVDAYNERRFDPQVTAETAVELDMIISDLEQVIRTAEKK